MNALNLLSIAGLVYDIVGAALLAEAIVRTRHESLMGQAQHGGSFTGGNFPLFAALEEQRHDARFGLGILIGGFLLQLGAALGWALPVDRLWSVLLTVILASVIAWWRVWARGLERSRIRRFANSLGGMDRANFLSRIPSDGPSSAIE